MFLFDRFDQHRVGFLSDFIICSVPATEYHLKLEVAVRSCCRASSPDMARHRMSNATRSFLLPRCSFMAWGNSLAAVQGPS